MAVRIKQHLGVLIVLVSWSSWAFSNCSVTTFVDGSTASAEEVNCNFQLLQSAVDDLESDLSGASKPSRIVWVAKEGGDYTNLVEAAGFLGSIQGASTEPVLIKIAPGTYQEVPADIEFRNNVFIEGSGQDATVLEYNSSLPALSISGTVVQWGISNLTLRNTAGPGVQAVATSNGVLLRDESYLSFKNVTLDVSSNNSVTALSTEGAMWVEIENSNIYAEARTAFKAVKGVSIADANTLFIAGAEIWANGGFTTVGLSTTGVGFVSVADSGIRISRELKFLGEYSDNTGVADAVHMVGQTFGVANHKMQGVQIVAQSAAGTGTGRGVVAMAGARVVATGSIIEASSGCPSSPCLPAYAAAASGVAPNTQLGSRIDIVGSSVKGLRQCSRDSSGVGCRDVCYLGVMVGDASISNQCVFDTVTTD